jgi:nucleoid DNA-binding protein
MSEAFRYVARGVLPDDHYVLTGFGTFEARKRAERKGRDIREQRSDHHSSESQSGVHCPRGAEKRRASDI